MRTKVATPGRGANPRSVPLQGDALHALGIAAAERLDWKGAIRYFRGALRKDPLDHRWQNDLAVALWAVGRRAAALRSFERTLATSPDTPGLILNYMKALGDVRDWERPHAVLASVLEIADDRSEILKQLATILQRAWRLTESESRWREYLALNPDDAAAWNNLAGILCRRGRIREASDAYAEASRCSFDPAVASSALMALHYDDQAGPQEIFQAHRAWASHFDAPRRERFPSNARRRKLRIGYVSGDLRRHSVACFFEPLLAHHDDERFEIYCFSNFREGDAVTRRLQHRAKWQDIFAMGDDETAATIRRCGIDVLVDLSGHTARNRLPVFARRPAPVQATYLGYPDTTGLSAIDYRFTDSIADPPGESDSHASEKLVRLDPCFLCYRPPRRFRSGNRRRGLFTFGSFAVREKLSGLLIETWASILRESESRLMLKAKSFADDSVREEIFLFFEKRGVTRERLTVLPYRSDPDQHLLDYHRVDLILDSFPYNGTTSTCEALSAGVPVLTWSGHTHAARVGASILRNCGLPQLVTDRAEDYRDWAIELARDRGLFAKLRRDIPDRWGQSPLQDGLALATRIEQHYWNWCRS